MTSYATLFNLGTLVAVLVLVAAFAVIRRVRGPLPPAPPKTGGQDAAADPAPPRAEE